MGLAKERAYPSRIEYKVRTFISAGYLYSLEHLIPPINIVPRRSQMVSSLMEPVTAVGAAASVLQFIGMAGKAIKYINDIKNAPRERGRLVQELNSLYGILIELECRVDEAKMNGDDKWLTGLNSLTVKFGPIERLGDALNSIVDKIKLASKTKTVGRTFIWPFAKKEIAEILEQIERQKSTISFALQGDQISLTKIIKADTIQIPALLTGVQEMQIGVTSIQNRLEAEAVQNIVDWFSPLSFGDRHNDILSRRCEGTGNWLFETPEASAWLLSPEKASLWCSGIPGAGKTTIAAIMTEHIEQSFIHDQSAAVACVYCNYKDKLVQTPANLLANIWMQIRRKGRLSPEMEELYASAATEGLSTRPRLDGICKILKAEVERYAKVYIIIDALDECEPAYRIRLLTELKALQPKVKLMVTSRFFDAFGADTGIDTDVEIHASDDDIKRFVQERVSTTHRLGRWIAADSSLQAMIETKVIEAAQNM